MVSAAPPASCRSPPLPLSFGDAPSRDARGPPSGVPGLEEVQGCLHYPHPHPHSFLPTLARLWGPLSKAGEGAGGGVGFFTSKGEPPGNPLQLHQAFVP